MKWIFHYFLVSMETFEKEKGFRFQINVIASGKIEITQNHRRFLFVFVANARFVHTHTLTLPNSIEFIQYALSCAFLISLIFYVSSVTVDDRLHM